MAQLTKLGWIISGSALSFSSEKGKVITTHNCSINSDLLDLVKRFWEQEEIANEISLTQEDEACEQHFTQTHTRQKNGRYMVRLPLEEGSAELGDWRPAAATALYCMEHRFEKQPDL